MDNQSASFHYLHYFQWMSCLGMALDLQGSLQQADTLPAGRVEQALGAQTYYSGWEGGSPSREEEDGNSECGNR